MGIGATLILITIQNVLSEETIMTFISYAQMLEANSSKNDKKTKACCASNYWTIWKLLYLALTCCIIILYNIYLLQCYNNNSCYVPLMEVILWTLLGGITFVPVPHLKGSNCLEEAESSKTIIEKKTSLPSYDTVIRQNKDQSKEKLWWSYDDFIIYM